MINSIRIKLVGWILSLTGFVAQIIPIFEPYRALSDHIFLFWDAVLI